MHKVTSGWYLDLLATSTAITLSFIRQDAVVLWGGLFLFHLQTQALSLFDLFKTLFYHYTII